MGKCRYTARRVTPARSATAVVVSAFLAGAGLFVATTLAGVLALPGELGAPRRQAPTPAATSTTTSR